MGLLDSIEQTVRRQIGEAQLLDWEERIAEYWSKQIDEVDEKQLYTVLKDWYGAKDAKDLVRKSRSDRLKAVIDGNIAYYVYRFCDKIRKCVGEGDTFQCHLLDLVEKPYSRCTVIWEDGQKYTVRVAGMVAIVGNVDITSADGKRHRCRVFPRWISHSFWQCSYSLGTRRN